MHVALIGCGGIARDGYLPALLHLRPDKVTLVDPDPTAGRAAQERLRSGGVNAEWQSDLARADASIEAAIIAVPPLHLPDAVDALLASSSPPLAILLEKPLGVNSTVASEMIQRASAVASVAYMETFLHSTAYDVLLDELASERLGAVSRIVLSVRGGTPANLESVWRGDRGRGGEVLHDWGIHSMGLSLHLLRSIAGRPESVEVDVLDTCWRVLGDRQLLTSCDMQVEGSPVPTSIRASWDGTSASPESPDVLVDCERGQLSLVVTKMDGSSNWTCVETRGEAAHCLASRRYPKELFIRGLDGFLRGVRNGFVMPDKYDVAMGLEALRLVDAAYSQAARK